MSILNARKLTLGIVILLNSVSAIAESGLPSKVPGNTFANSSEYIMNELHGRAMASASKMHNCEVIEVLETQVTKVVPADEENGLAGDASVERWLLNACGNKMEVFFSIVPVGNEPPEFVISVAVKK